jgi:hypothetical protein
MTKPKTINNAKLQSSNNKKIGFGIQAFGFQLSLGF